MVLPDVNVLVYAFRTDAPDHPARRILECLGRAGSKVLRKNLKEYSVERGDRLTADHELGAILVAECARAADFLGVGDHEVYLIPSQGAEVVVEMHEPPALLFSVIVTELSEVEQRVLAVQALCQVRFCSAPAHKLGAAELEELFIAAARLFHPDFASDVTGTRRVDELREELDSCCMIKALLILALSRSSSFSSTPSASRTRSLTVTFSVSWARSALVPA